MPLGVEYEKTKYETKGNVAYITLNRPEKKNAIDWEANRELASGWKAFRDDEDLYVAILSGDGNTFCSGFDIGAMAPIIHKGEFKLLRDSAIFGYGEEHMMIPSRHRITKPIVASMDGHVTGAGLILALDCDIRIATNETRFSLLEGRINFPVEFSALLPRYIPIGIANEMLLAGGTISADRAYEVGMVQIGLTRLEWLTRWFPERN
jgi:enoyl-CoA hydratase/carnithine racemase